MKSKLVSSLTGDDKRFLALCLLTAMRRGEVLGLRWEDIYAGKIHVKRTMTMYNSMWRHILASVDMHGATPHVLRHSYLTYAVGAATDFRTIQGISGHSDVFTLMNRYARPQEDKKVELAEEMTRILTQNAASPKTL